MRLLSTSAGTLGLAILLSSSSLAEGQQGVRLRGFTWMSEIKNATAKAHKATPLKVTDVSHQPPLLSCHPDYPSLGGVLGGRILCRPFHSLCAPMQVEYKDKSSNFFLALKKEKGQVSTHFSYSHVYIVRAPLKLAKLRLTRARSTRDLGDPPLSTRSLDPPSYL